MREDIHIQIFTCILVIYLCESGKLMKHCKLLG